MRCVVVICVASLSLVSAVLDVHAEQRFPISTGKPAKIIYINYGGNAGVLKVDYHRKGVDTWITAVDATLSSIVNPDITVDARDLANTCSPDSQCEVRVAAFTLGAGNKLVPYPFDMLLNATSGLSVVDLSLTPLPSSDHKYISLRVIQD